VANDCSVEETLAAHAKAQALIDKYQVSHEELYGTGPGPRSRKREPEPAERKQEQQPAPDNSARIGELFPFKAAIAVGIVLIAAVLWGKSVVTGMSGPFKPSSLVADAPKDTTARRISRNGPTLLPTDDSSPAKLLDQSTQAAELGDGSGVVIGPHEI